VYGVAEIDREAIYAAETDEGAFVRTTKETVRKTIESYMRNEERIWFNDGTGALGTGDGSTAVTGAGTTGDPYLVIISSATWKEANWEEKDFVNVGTEETLVEVYEVVPASRQVKLVGTSATLAAASAGATGTSAVFYMQNSRNNDPLGLKGVLEATTGTLYTIPVQRRWKAGVQAASGGAGLTTDMLNEDMLEIRRKCGKDPNLIQMSFTQFRKFLNLLEDQKEYPVEPRAENLKGKVSFRGIEYISQSGSVPVFANRFIEDDRIYYLNDNFLTCYHRPGHGWFNDDGTVFLRKSNDDAYEARYGGYKENYIVPPFHGYRDGLAT
jgi:hypothetical protein